MRHTSARGWAVRSAALLAATVLAAPLAGCGSEDSSSTAAPSSAAAEPVRIEDPWVKAADKGMTAAFGTLVNDSETDVTVTSAATAISPVELHQMAMKDGKMVMQVKPGGLLVKARSSHKLEPGGDHLMLMALKGPVAAGEQLSFTLTLADGKTVAFSAVAKPFTGAGEDYVPGHGESPAPSASAKPSATAKP
ncbi:copper chaperone PCu(A)C [Pilimelia columellifera]|uniref:Copper chaperone PCu(A)C n=1 Tax=Pilimelia columellifera subsp. columellifera TaxID=706583 RepID=A0ABN3NQN9_9ACTN